MPKRREGPTRNKATGYFFLDLFVGFGKEKKRIRYSLRTKDPEKAQWLWEQEYRKQWSKYYGIEPKIKPAFVKFSEIIEEFVDYEKNIKKVKDWKTVGSRLNFMLDCWGDLSLQNIDKEKFIELDSFLRKNKRSEFTINHYFKILKTLFFYAIRTGKYTGENPIKEIKPYVVDEKRREYSSEEIAKIIAAAEKIEKEARKYAVMQQYAKRIVLILFHTAMRLGEVLNLKWDNIKEGRIVLRRSETKPKKEKVIPLTDSLKRIFEEIRKEEKDDVYILPLRRRSGKMRAGWADSIIKRIREYSGIQDFIFHNLRHTASTIMVSEALGKGVGLADIMKILGHSKIETTMKYLHADDSRMRKAMEILEEKTKGD